MNKIFRHYVPSAQRKEAFPFSFLVEEVETKLVKPHTTITFEVYGKEDLMKALNLALQTVFEFYKYLDQDSDYYLPKIKGDYEKEPIYYIGIDVVDTVEEKVEGKQNKKVKKVINNLLIKCYEFSSKYSYTMIKSIEHLKTILDGATILTYDVETSGLDPEFDIVSGINFATNKDFNAGYYIPLNHVKPYDNFNLSQEAFDIFYEAMTKADKVCMFNARFDIRNAEYQDYTFNPISQNIDNIRYDMSKVNFIDTQILAYFADPSWKQTSLEWAEQHFLGFNRLNLKDIIGLYGSVDFNTSLIDPRLLLFYAGQDAVSTLLLYFETIQYLDEFGLSGLIDMEIIYPLMKMENRLIKIDTEYVEQELAKLDKRLDEVETLIIESIGKEINLNSPKQKQELFKSFGLDTGKRTRTGAMSTAKDAVDSMIERLDNAGKEYPEFLKYLGEQGQLQQLRSTFFYALQQQMYHRDGRVRLNYRHGSTSTGRFSSGKEEL